MCAVQCSVVAGVNHRCCPKAFVKSEGGECFQWIFKALTTKSYHCLKLCAETKKSLRSGADEVSAKHLGSVVVWLSVQNCGLSASCVAQLQEKENHFHRLIYIGT